MKTIREYALQILVRIETEQAFSNILLEHVLHSNQIKSKDRNLLTEMVNGTIKMRAYLDWILQRFLKKPLSKMTPPIRNNLRLGVYQLLFLERVPAFAIINEAVKLAKQYGHQGVANLVNATLRNIDRNRGNINLPDPKQSLEKYIAIKYSHPEWLIQRWLRRWGEKSTNALCQINNLPPPVTIRVNSLKTSSDELKQLLMTAGINTESTSHPHCLHVLDPTSLIQSTLYHRGFFYVQDVSWAFIVQLLNPQPGETILDYCSAPGGKATHIAEQMGNIGKIIALDIHSHRLNRVRENSHRLGIDIIESSLVDSFDFNHQPTFDRVLVDVPCSGLGVLRRRADARWQHQESDLSELATVQFQILSKAASHVKDGGVLVYSTCTTEPEENENLINRFCKIHHHFVIEPADQWVSSSLTDESGAIRILPHLHQMDGAYAVRLRKK